MIGEGLHNLTLVCDLVWCESVVRKGLEWATLGKVLGRPYMLHLNQREREG